MNNLTNSDSAEHGEDQEENEADVGDDEQGDDADELGSDSGSVGEHEDSRSWYTKSDLASPYFPFPSIEVAKFMAWDCAPPMISRRKLDSLLRIITDPSFDISKLAGYSAKKLRRTRRKLPIIPVRQVRTSVFKPAAVSVSCLCTVYSSWFSFADRGRSRVDGQGKNIQDDIGPVRPSA